MCAKGLFTNTRSKRGQDAGTEVPGKEGLERPPGGHWSAPGGDPITLVLDGGKTNKGLSSQAMVFPVVLYGCESWTVKKAEHRRTDAFELWCWRRLLRVPWTARRSSQSILNEISPGCSLEGLMLQLKLQYFGHLM